MRIVYLGTPDFSVAPLERLINKTEHEIVAVVCNKDKPFGRKKILTPPPVKVFAQSKNIPVYQYDKIRVEGVEDIKSLAPDLMITCAFGQILSKEILDIPKFGVINIHASLLPKLRGASPIHYAILNGENKTGISIMKTDVGIDTGDVLLQKEIKIGEFETCGQLFERLSILGADCIVEALELIEKGQAKFIPQQDDKATFSKIIKKEDALIDWKDLAINVFNKVRAFNPSPVAYTFFNGEPFKVYECEFVDGEGESGQVIKADKELIIACGKGAIKLKTVQKAGGKQMKASDFLLGNKLEKGFIFGK